MAGKNDPENGGTQGDEIPFLQPSSPGEIRRAKSEREPCFAAEAAF
ncbi:MAG: hypothetical protein ACRD4C_10940 [Candidatus Acidiferrales bacterium]